MAKNKSVKAWIHQHVNDHYVKSATVDGYRSRAAYKLLEINQKYNLFKNVTKVVDLGSAPGSWGQVIIRNIGATGVVIGIDLLDMEPIYGLTFIQGDFTHDDILAKLVDKLNGDTVDLLVSDMSPNLSGIKGVDQAKAAGLIELVIDFAENYLGIDGKCVIKVFHGGEFNNLLVKMRSIFRQVVIFKPNASRSKSSETYLLGLGKNS